jgi:hypothetical protein
LTFADQASTSIYLIGPVEDQQLAADALEDQLGISVSVLDPFDQLIGGLEQSTCDRSRFANLIGIACAWNHGPIEIDLLHPRRGPQKPNPWHKVGFWSAIAAASLGLFGYVAWDDYRQRTDELEEQRDRLRQVSKEMTRALEKQDAVDVIERWRANDVNWLDELRDLSEHLPSAEQVLVKGLSGKTDAQGRGVLEFSVQVENAEVKAEIDRALRHNDRSVTIKQVTESPGQGDLTWRFDAQVLFIPPPPDSLPVEGTP